MSNLVISDLHVDILTEGGPKQILKGADLTMNSGEVYTTMGPNGSGKSALVYAIAGHPRYEIISGSVTPDGVELIDLTVDGCVRQDLSLAMQYPVEMPGVSVMSFLRTARTALNGKAPKTRAWVRDVEDVLNRMNLGSPFSACSVSEGFLGDEGKRHEIARFELPNPGAAIPDKTGSGLDIDALRIVSEEVNRYSAQGDRAVMLTAHYTCILHYVDPTFVHVFVDGHVVDQGGRELADKLEVEDCEAYVKAAAANVRAASESGNGSRRKRELK